jgi:hypothetical protein
MPSPTLGPHVLVYTPHAVVTAGFHRNNAGNLDQLAFFTGTEAEAREIATRRGIDYLAVCPSALEAIWGGAAEPFARQLASGTLWPWLVRLSDPDDVVQIYGVNKDALIIPGMALRGSYPSHQ